MTNEERAKKNEKKKPNKKLQDPKIKQDLDYKERIIREERIRLQNESHKKKLVNSIHYRQYYNFFAKGTR